MANGKHKGGAFEREVCKLLSLWWTNYERDDVFYRSASSGGRATARSRRGKNTANSHGDIMAVDPIGQPLIDLICFEIKRGYNRCTIHDLIDRPDHAAKQEWEKWIEQAEESCKGAGSYGWAIIHQRDRREPIILIPQIVMNQLMGNDNGFHGEPHICMSFMKTNVCSEKLSDFLGWVTPKMIRKFDKDI